MKKLFLLAVAFVLLAGCVQTGVQPSATPSPAMRKVALNDTVRIDYTAKRASDGFVFESTIREVALKAGLREREVYEPLKFTVGAGKVIPVGLEGAVLGMSQGEFKIATVPAAEGFGVHNDSLVFVANKSDLVYGGESLHAGQWLLEQFGGANCMVLNVSNSTFTADCNHPLAGEALEFEITLVEIANASR